MAETRKYDLEMLMNDRRGAKNAFERDLYDRTIDRILRENNVVRKERENLVQAVRSGDRRAVHYFQNRLMKIKANETYGKDY